MAVKVGQTVVRRAIVVLGFVITFVDALAAVR